MSIADDLALPGGCSLSWAVFVQGVPRFFSSVKPLGVDPQAIDIKGGAEALMWSDGEFLAVLAEVPQESESRIDTHQHVQVGGGFSFRLHDDLGGIVRGLIRPRSQRVAYLTADVSPTDVTLTLSSTSSLPSSGVVYVAGETVRYTGKTSTTLTGCTRGAYNSRAQSHRGGSVQGASVFTAPPAWYGRRVWFVAVTSSPNASGDEHQVENAYVVGTYRVELAPHQPVDGRWDIQCSHLSDELHRRKLGVGITDIEVGRRLSPVTEDSVPRLLFVARDGTEDLFTQSAVAGFKTHALVELEGLVRERAIFEIVKVDGDLVFLSRSPLTTAGATSVRVAGVGIFDVQVKSVRHIAVMEGRPPYVILVVALVSNLGNLSSSVWDWLPGLQATEFGGPFFRFGAGMDPSEIDIDSFQAVTDEVGPWSYVIDEEIPVTTLLRDFLAPVGCIALYSRDGILRCKRQTIDRASSAATIGDGDLLEGVPPRVEQLDHDVFPRIRMTCGYDPVDRRYEQTIDVVDGEMLATYPEAEDQLQLESRALVAGPMSSEGSGSLIRQSTPTLALLPLLRREMLGNRGGRLMLTLRLPARFWGLELGDLVTLNLARCYDFEGGAVVGRRGRVLALRTLYAEGAIDVTVEVLDQLAHIAPAARITAWDAGTLTLTLATSDLANADANPGSAMLPTMDARIISADGGLTYIDTVTVVSSTATTAVLAFAPTNAPQVGDFLVLAELSGSGPSANGFQGEDFAYQQPDDEGATVSILSRWR